MLRNLAVCRIPCSPWSQQYWSGEANTMHLLNTKSRVSPLYLTSISYQSAAGQPRAPCLPTGSAPPGAPSHACSAPLFGKDCPSFCSSLVLSQMLQLPSPVSVSFIKCFQYWNNVGKRGWKIIKDLLYIKNCDFSRNSIHTEFFFQGFYFLHSFLIWVKDKESECVGLLRTQQPVQILLLAPELPGPAAGWALSCSHCSPSSWTCLGCFTFLHPSSHLGMLQLQIPPIEHSSFPGKLSPPAKGL